MQTTDKIDPLTWPTRERLSFLSFCAVVVLLGMSISDFSVHTFAEDLVVTISGEEIQFVKIPAGRFVMGSKKTTEERISVLNNGPEHQVTISRPFQMGKYEVTMEQWDALMDTNPSGRAKSYEKLVAKLKKLDPQFNDSWARHWLDKSKSENIPIDSVSWEEVQEYIYRLNQADTSHHYRLPTEAEWEYACQTPNPEGIQLELDDIAHWSGNSGNEWKQNPERLLGPKMPLPVGSKQPNAWGLHDMQGNVWEWVHDWYNPYSEDSQVDPSGPTKEEAEMFEYRGVKTPGKVFRGGSWLNWGFAEQETNPSYRDRRPANFRHTDLGFRLLRTTK